MKSVLDPAFTFMSQIHSDITKSFAYTRRARSSLRSRTGGEGSSRARLMLVGEQRATRKISRASPS